MTKSLVILPLFICFFQWLSAQDSNEPLTWDPQVRKGKLENGLTYYIRENKRPEKKVELRLVVNVGSIVEDDDQQGLAHMAEHMAFNGTRNFKKNEIVSFLQDIGVGFGSDLNAYTGFDETVYILPIPTDKPGNLEKGFQVLEDWAHNVTYLTEDINNERAIILEESRLGKSGEERMFKKVYPELFRGSKYARRLPIGIDSIIRNFNPDAIRRFYREWYRPDLMAVIVVGDISGDSAMAMIRKHFAGLKNPAQPRIREYATVPPYPASQAMVVTDKEATGFNYAVNYSAYAVKPSLTVGEYRADLVKNLYTAMLNSRFRELTQKENPPFVYAYAGFDSYAVRYESFNVQASTGTNDIRTGINAVSDEIERMKRYGFTEAELDRAKKNMMSSYDRMWNNRDKNESQNYAEEYIRNFTEQEPVPGIDKEYSYVKQALPGITLAEVNKLTDIYKNETNRFAYVMGPESAANVSIPSNTDVLALMDARLKADIGPWEEKAVATSLLKTAPKGGKVLSQSKDAALGTTELILSNGIKVTLKPTDFKDDQVLMGMSRFGGIGGYGLDDKYSAENAVAVVSAMGAGEFSPTDLRKALAGKTASLTPSLSQTQEAFRGSSSKKDVETMFQLLNLYVTLPRKDSSLFKSLVQRSKAQYMMLGANPQVAFFDTLNRILYNNNPLRPTAVPKAENFDRINMDRALQIYSERLGDLSGMHMYIVGSFTESEIIPLLEQYVAGLPAGGKKYTWTDNKVRPLKGKKEFTFRKGTEDKSLIIGYKAGEIPYAPETALKLSALSEVLNIKIIEELREKIQGIYGGGTYAVLNKVPYPYYQFVLQLPCGPAKVDTLIKAFNNELNSIAAKGPAISYLDKVKKQWLEEYRTNMKTNEFWLSKLSEIQYGETVTDRFINWEKYVNQLKPADVQQAAKMVQSSPSQVMAVLMPGKK